MEKYLMLRLWHSHNTYFSRFKIRRALILTNYGKWEESGDSLQKLTSDLNKNATKDTCTPSKKTGLSSGTQKGTTFWSQG